MCGQGGTLYTELDAAAKKVRDSLSVRTQLDALPMGDVSLVIEITHRGSTSWGLSQREVRNAKSRPEKQKISYSNNMFFI